jgi:hypothetical protein
MSPGDNTCANADCCLSVVCVQVLVASDVASRGLDIRGLPYVVNYDFPSNLEVYIHRVGRTGRLAAAGHAFSFFTRPLVSQDCWSPAGCVVGVQHTCMCVCMCVGGVQGSWLPLGHAFPCFT